MSAAVIFHKILTCVLQNLNAADMLHFPRSSAFATSNITFNQIFLVVKFLSVHGNFIVPLEKFERLQMQQMYLIG